jgi:hypothetical protein
MNMARYLYAWLFCLCLLGNAQAIPLIVDFHGNEPEVVLGRNAQIMEDADKSLSLNALRNREHGWTNYHADTFNFGFDRSSWCVCTMPMTTRWIECWTWGLHCKMRSMYTWCARTALRLSM